MTPPCGRESRGPEKIKRTTKSRSSIFRKESGEFLFEGQDKKINELKEKGSNEDDYGKCRRKVTGFPAPGMGQKRRRNPATTRLYQLFGDAYSTSGSCGR